MGQPLWLVRPHARLPIFDRGRWKTVQLYDVRAQEAALAYRRTVLNALHEVENALAAYAQISSGAPGWMPRSPRIAMHWLCRGSAMRAV